MTRVDFYIADNTKAQDRMRLGCKIVDKAARSGKKTIVAVDDQAEASLLDNLLWQFEAESFTPHCISADSIHECKFVLSAKISTVIDFHGHNYPNADVLINLCTTRPVHFSQYERLVECITQETSVLQTGRDNHKFYKERGYPIHVHKVGVI